MLHAYVLDKFRRQEKDQSQSRRNRLLEFYPNPQPQRATPRPHEPRHLRLTDRQPRSRRRRCRRFFLRNLILVLQYTYSDDAQSIFCEKKKTSRSSYFYLFDLIVHRSSSSSSSSSSFIPASPTVLAPKSQIANHQQQQSQQQSQKLDTHGHGHRKPTRRTHFHLRIHD